MSLLGFAVSGTLIILAFGAGIVLGMRWAPGADEEPDEDYRPIPKPPRFGRAESSLHTDPPRFVSPSPRRHARREGEPDRDPPPDPAP